MRVESTMLAESTKLRAGANTHWKHSGSESVVVDFTTGNYFVLDDVCSFFWGKLLEGPRTSAELVDAALAEYEVEREELAANVRNFCQYVLAEKLAEAE